MKKLLVALCAYPILVAAQQKPFTLKVAVPGLQEDTKVYAFYIGVNKKLTKDSAYIKNGSCSFAGNLAEPYKGVVRIDAGGKITDIAMIYFEPGTHILKGKDSLHTARVMGSTLNDEFKEFQKSTDRYLNQLVAIKIAAPQLAKEAGKEAEVKAMNEKYRLLADTMKKLQLAFVKAHRKSFLSLDLLKPYANAIMDVVTIGPLFNSLSDELKATPSGEVFAKALAKAETVKIGNKAPIFTSYTPAGDSLRLQDIVGKSKLLLVDFWASWCGPCRAENPNVVKAYQLYHDKGFDIISVSLDEKAALWKAALSKENMPWYNASSLQGWNDPAALLYGVHGIPDNFLVGADGKIIARGLRGPALQEKLKEILDPSQKAVNVRPN